jgi:branched-chain amino acid transport system substrate-binding protein
MTNSAKYRITRRKALGGAAAVAAAAVISRGASADDMPGVSATEIKIGQTMPYSGNASAYGAIGRTDLAVFKMINDQGGINGRKLNLISVDDGYLPPRTVEQTRRLVEEEGVAFMFNTLGTPTNSAIHKYLNMKKVPQLFVATGADKWGDYKHYPWTMGWQPSYRIEAQIYAKYILQHLPDAKVGILYQNDDFGKDYMNGIKDIFGDKFDKLVVKAVSYESTDPTIDSQIVTLQSSGANVFVNITIPKFGAQAIRKVYDLGWRPTHFITNVSASVGAVIKPAGVEKAFGIISGVYLKDNTDPAWANDPGMNEWRAFMSKYMPGADLNDGNHVYGYGVSLTLVQVLKQCGNDLSRANIMRQAANLHDLDVKILLPGIKVNTSPTNYHPLRQLQLAKWNGKTWERFGEILSATAT